VYTKTVRKLKLVFYWVCGKTLKKLIDFLDFSLKANQGINWDLIKKHAEKRGEKVAFLENAPNLSVVNIDIWEAFIFLTERGRNFNGAISLDSIINYMNEFKIEEREEFIFLISELDSYYRGSVENGKSKIRN